MRASLGALYLGYRRARAAAATVTHGTLGRALVLSARVIPSLRRHRPVVPESPERILAVALQKIGDAVTTEPALRILRARYPRARLEVAAAASRERGPTMGPYEVFKLMPQVDAVHAIRRLRDLRALAGQQDLVVSLGLTARDAWAALVARGSRGVALGYDWRQRGHALDVSITPPGQVMLTATEAYARNARPQHTVWGELLVRAGITDDARVTEAGAPRLVLDPAHERDVRALLGERGIEAPYTVFHPWNAQAHYRWAEASWVALGRALVEAGLVRSVVVDGGTGKDEVAHAVRVARAIGVHATSFAGTFGIDRGAALLAHAGLVVAVDSGPSHLARAVSAPTVVLFGPGSPAVWASPGSTALQRREGCHGCRQPRCYQERRECLDELSVESVVAAATKILSPVR
jgi:ADP-heptose:LPS heptosyltransferase